MKNVQRVVPLQTVVAAYNDAVERAVRRLATVHLPPHTQRTWMLEVKQVGHG